MLAACKAHVVYSDQLLGAALRIHFISNHDTNPKLSYYLAYGIIPHCLVSFSLIPDGITGDDLLLTRPAILRHCQLAPKHPLDNLTTLIEAETFQVFILNPLTIVNQVVHLVM